MESSSDADAKYPDMLKSLQFLQVLRNCLDIMHWLLVLARTDGTALPFFLGLSGACESEFERRGRR